MMRLGACRASSTSYTRLMSPPCNSERRTTFIPGPTRATMACASAGVRRRSGFMLAREPLVGIVSGGDRMQPLDRVALPVMTWAAASIRHSGGRAPRAPTRCGNGSRGSRRQSLADYVAGRGATAARKCYSWLFSWKPVAACQAYGDSGVDPSGHRNESRTAPSKPRNCSTGLIRKKLHRG